MVTLFSTSSHFPMFLSPSVQSLPGGIDKAVAYLEKRLPALTNPYAVAMTSYALAQENKLNREILYNFISPGVVTQKYFLSYSETVHRCRESESAITTMGSLEPTITLVQSIS